METLGTTWRRAVDYLVYLVVRIAICAVQAISLETAERLANGLAWLFADVLRIRNNVVDENLAHAFPRMSIFERRNLARAMWRYLFLLVVEVAHAPRKIHETNWRDHILLRDADVLLRLYFEKRPILVTLGHFGNFEVGGYGLALLGVHMSSIARTLDNPFLDEYVNNFRRLTGQRLVAKNGAFDEIVDVLAQGGALGVLADQYAGPKGCWVNFFNRPASAHKAIALLSFEHQAPVVIVYARQGAKPLQLELGTYALSDPAKNGPETRSVRDLTQWYTTRLEEIIGRTPEQYWWLHRRWKDTRPPRSAEKKKVA